MRKSPLYADFEHGRNVRLKLYVAGVPFSHDRDLSRAERRQIIFRVGRPLILGLAGHLLAYGVFCYIGLPGFGIVLPFFAALLMLAYFSRFMPYFTALRDRQVHIYIGRLGEQGSGLLVRRHFGGCYSEFASVSDQSVEMLCLGSDHRVWMIEGYPAKTELQKVAPTLIAMLPDAEEVGARNLTTPELLELRVRLRHEIGTVVTVPLLVYLASLLTVLGVTRVSPNGILFYIVGGFLAFALTAIRLRKAWPAIRTLRRDIRAGTVREGRLSSGLLWVAKGEPAAWRVSSIPAHASLTSVTNMPNASGEVPESVAPSDEKPTDNLPTQAQP